jgi:hypothetical protein
MSADLRESVLARLADILAGVSDFLTVARNLDELPETKRPCAILIDGDEVRTPDTQGRNGQPIMIDMSPVVSIGVSADDPADVGPAVSSLRAQVIKAVLFDAQLYTILGANGRIIYDGATSKLSHGSILNGDVELRFVFTYPLKPRDL